VFKKIELGITFTLLLWGLELAAQDLRKPTVECKKHFDKRIAADVFLNPTTDPSFPGGNPAWIRFLNKKFQYPEAEIKNGTFQTRATATFIVDSAGLLHYIAIKGKKEIDLSPFEKSLRQSCQGVWSLDTS